MLPNVYQVYQLYVGNLTVSHQTSNVALQSPHTGPYVQVVTIGHLTLDVTWGSQNSSLASNATALPHAVSVSLSPEESPLAAVCTDNGPDTLLSTHKLDDVFAETKTSDFNDGEGKVVSALSLHQIYCCVLLPPQAKQVVLTLLKKRVLTLHYRMCSPQSLDAHMATRTKRSCLTMEMHHR